jgi:hypothetical protein
MTTEEIIAELATKTKDFTQEQWQDISFGLIRIGEFMAKRSFPHEAERKITSAELAEIMVRETGIPKYVFSLNDFEYKILKIEDAKRILEKRGKWYNTNRTDNPWLLDFHDCDNHAYKCASDFNFIFEVNPVTVDSGAMVWKDKDGIEHRDSHKFNVLVAVDTDGEIRCWLYEQQENFIAKFENQKAWRGNCDYQIYWVEAY